MLTQPVLVARLSTHAWAPGKGPTLFTLRQQRRGETVEKAGSCLRSGHACICACLHASTFKEQTWGELRHERALGEGCLSLIIKQTYCLSTELPLLCSHTLLPSFGFLGVAVHGAESFITHFPACLFLFSGFPGFNPPSRLRTLFKGNVFTLLWQNACQHLAVWLWRVNSYHSRRFKKKKKKSCRLHSVLSEAVRTNICFHVSAAAYSKAPVTLQHTQWLS